MKATTCILFLLLIFSNTSFAQSARACKKVQTGEFEFPLSDGNLFMVSRNDTLQIETVNGDSKYYDVKWLDECTYKLIPRFVMTIPVGEEEIPINEVVFEIIEVKAHSYSTMARMKILCKDHFVVSTLHEKGYSKK